MPAEHVPTESTRQEVRSLKGFGATNEAVSKLLGITADTLAKHYPEEIETANILTNHRVAGNLYRIATTGDDKQAVPAAIFWLKCRAGWRTSDMDQMVSEIEALRSQLGEAHERLTRLATPRKVA
jgi:hypothetical protein